MIIIKPSDVYVDYTLNIVASTDPIKAEQEVELRLISNTALQESLKRDKINQVPVDVAPLPDGRYILIEGFCRTKYLKRLEEEGHDVQIKCIVHDIKPDDKIGFWLIQSKNEQRSDKTPLARAFTVQQCFNKLREQNPSIKQSEVADQLGISTGLLSTYINIMRDNTAVELIRTGYMEFTTAQALVSAAQKACIKTSELWGMIKPPNREFITINSLNEKLNDLWLTSTSKTSNGGIDELPDFSTELDDLPHDDLYIDQLNDELTEEYDTPDSEFISILTDIIDKYTKNNQLTIDGRNTLKDFLNYAKTNKYNEFSDETGHSPVYA